MKKELQQSLKSLKVEYLDLYQFHNVSDKKTYDTILGANGAMEALQEARKAGEIRHIGISSHQIDIAKEAVKSDRFETIMYPTNFVANEAEDELLALARKHDVGVIAMKPLAGGRIINIKIAFKYLWQLADVLMLPGMKTIREVEEIVQVLEKPGMTKADQKEMQRLREELSVRFCRHCEYCMPCPQGLVVAAVMDYEALLSGFIPERLYTGRFSDMFAQATKCDECGECDEKCPYDIPVSSMVKEFTGKYHENKKKYEAGLLR
ncbi:MAG: hypothetical protein A2144_00395 [Chloroflexi bacterium RBG_16_50_9]|nr:MAG: hypothetical protein A2144_00395 [Chloroflexi bacterium RBG_16_50_9]